MRLVCYFAGATWELLTRALPWRRWQKLHLLMLHVRDVAVVLAAIGLLMLVVYAVGA